jgi:hypothetical protein
MMTYQRCSERGTVLRFDTDNLQNIILQVKLSEHRQEKVYIKTGKGLHVKNIVCTSGAYLSLGAKCLHC